MTERFLPPQPNLDHLRRQARELLRAVEAGDAAARSRWRAARGQDPTAKPQLRGAQTVVAHEYGFASWDALRGHVEQLVAPGEQPQHRRGVGLGTTPDKSALTIDTTLASQDAQSIGNAVSVRICSSAALASFARLAPRTSVRRLDLSGLDDVRDDDLRFLEQMPWLTALSLDGCQQITDATIVRLQAHVALEEVLLRWTAVGDAGLAALAGKPRLHRIACGSALTSTGVAHLRDYPALATRMSADSLVSLGTCRRLDDRALEHVGQLGGVVALDLSHSVFGSDYGASGLAHLRMMGALEELNVKGSLVTDVVLGMLAEIRHLRRLACQDPVAGDQGFTALAESSTLEVLWLRRCTNVTDRGFVALAKLPRLRSLGAGGLGVTDAALAPFAAGPLTDLTPVLFGDSAFRHIRRLRYLKRLTNASDDTGDAAIASLDGHETLQRYVAFGTRITDGGLAILARLPRITSVRLEGCGEVTDVGLRLLRRNPAITEIHAEDCPRVSGDWRGTA